MDSNKYSVLLVSLRSSDSEGDFITNAGYPVTYDGDIYRNAESLEVELPPVSSSLDTKECNVKNIPIAGTFLTHLSNNYPFTKVEAKVIELDIDADTSVVTDTRTLFNGLLYQASPAPLIGYMELVCREWKYYTDITAGVPCTEQCAWSVLGGKGCGASVTMETHTVDSVSGLDLTIVGGFSDTTPFLFNKGYVEVEGARIKIAYHESGSTMRLSKAPPSDWVGGSVSIYAGCDRQLETCRSIHNNEANFLGLGIAMVDYNPFYEGA